MTTSVRALILRAFDHHAPTAQDVLRRRGDEVAKLRAVIADLRRDNIRLLNADELTALIDQLTAVRAAIIGKRMSTK